MEIAKEEKKKLRKIMIVVEDKEDGRFSVYLDGDKERIGAIPDPQLTPTEFWAGQIIRQAQKIMMSAGVVKGMRTPGFVDGKKA